MEYLTDKQKALLERNNKIIARWDEMQGAISAIVKTIADEFELSAPLVRRILRKANKIGRGE